MTALNGRQQLELAMLCEGVTEASTEGDYDSPAGQKWVAVNAALTKYIFAEGITPDMFGDRLKGELIDAHSAAYLVERVGPSGLHPESMGGRILTAAGIPYPVEEDDEDEADE